MELVLVTSTRLMVLFLTVSKTYSKNTYRFDQAIQVTLDIHSDFIWTDTQSYSTEFTTNLTPGSAGAYTEIVVSDSTPPVLHYQCSAHANMGWASTTSTRNLTGFDTDDLSEGSRNSYFTNARADARIAAATTDDLSEGSSNFIIQMQERKQYLSIML